MAEVIVKDCEKAAAVVEQKVVNEVKAAEEEVKKIEGVVVAEAKKFATEARIDITDAEKLMVTKMENQFLRANSEIRRLQDEAKALQDTFPRVMEQLSKRYLINPLTHTFSTIELAFLKK